MRLPRMTTRRWMIAVGLLALGFGVAVGLYRRSLRFEEKAQEFGRLRQVFEGLNTGDQSFLNRPRAVAPGEGDLSAEARERQSESRQLARYYSDMEAKYRRATRYP